MSDPRLGDPLAPRAPGPPWTRRVLVLGALLLVGGGWLLLESAGVKLPPLSRHWPLFLFAGAIASIADWWLVSRRPGALGRGVFVLTIGVAIYMLTLEQLHWRDLHVWGPDVYLAIGLGCFAAWAAGGQRSTPLLVIGALGVGTAITLWAAGTIPLGVFWGGLLLLVGIALILQVLRRDRSG